MADRKIVLAHNFLSFSGFRAVPLTSTALTVQVDRKLIARFLFYFLCNALVRKGRRVLGQLPI